MTTEATTARESGRVTRAALERIVGAAIQAPSGDNCQPWRFGWDGAELAITQDPRRARHAIDHNHHGSIVTLGCVLESISLAAGAEGLSATAELSLDLLGPGARWATVRFAPSEASPDPLALVIPRRCTDRRPHLGGSLAAAQLPAIQRDAARFPGCAIHGIERYGDELLAYLMKADSYGWMHEDIYLDVLQWVRFSQEEIERTRDGIPWQACGIEAPGVRLLRFARSSLARRAVVGLGLHGGTGAWLRAMIASSAGLLCVTVASRRKEDLVAAGRLGLSAWLRLNRAGYAVQPLTIHALPVYNAAVGGMPAGTLPEYVDLYERGSGILSRAFSYPSGDLPVWMFRTGRARSVPAEIRSRRLPIEQILSLRDESPPEAG